MRKLAFFALSIGIAGIFLNAHAQTPAASRDEPVVLADTEQASYNWAGYVADTASQYSAVSASWIVPSVSGQEGSDLSADATWVGIGGVDTHDLIQTGTQALVQNGSVVYQAWWEALPGVSQPLALRVSPGDSVTAAITYIEQGQWSITLINNTTGKRAHVTIAYNSSFSSAEWVEEAPSLATNRGHRPLIPLTHFGAVAFSGAYTVADGKAVSLGDAGAQPLRMVGWGGTTLAAPSVIGSNGRFSVVESDVAQVATLPAQRQRVVILQQSL
ncbi:MAG: G1 family glutamic endopeptidase [Patescibacteria group bacterium]